VAAPSHCAGPSEIVVNRVQNGGPHSGIRSAATSFAVEVHNIARADDAAGIIGGGLGRLGCRRRPG
jgi:hypothetical protein